jgi:hypothetical protein
VICQYVKFPCDCGVRSRDLVSFRVGVIVKVLLSPIQSFRVNTKLVLPSVGCILIYFHRQMETTPLQRMNSTIGHLADRMIGRPNTNRLVTDCDTLNKTMGGITIDLIMDVKCYCA